MGEAGFEIIKKIKVMIGKKNARTNLSEKCMNACFVTFDHFKDHESDFYSTDARRTLIVAGDLATGIAQVIVPLFDPERSLS